jgi:hypothetical protein
MTVCYPLSMTVCYHSVQSVTTHFSLLPTQYSLLPTQYSLLPTQYSLLPLSTVCYPLSTVCYHSVQSVTHSVQSVTTQYSLLPLSTVCYPFTLWLCSLLFRATGYLNLRPDGQVQPGTAAISVYQTVSHGPLPVHETFSPVLQVQRNGLSFRTLCTPIKRDAACH